MHVLNINHNYSEVEIGETAYNTTNNGDTNVNRRFTH
jgi:hypothetical protein